MDRGVGWILLLFIIVAGVAIYFDVKLYERKVELEHEIADLREKLTEAENKLYDAEYKLKDCSAYTIEELEDIIKEREAENFRNYIVLKTTYDSWDEQICLYITNEAKMRTFKKFVIDVEYPVKKGDKITTDNREFEFILKVEPGETESYCLEDLPVEDPDLVVVNLKYAE